MGKLTELHHAPFSGACRNEFHIEAVRRVAHEGVTAAQVDGQSCTGRFLDGLHANLAIVGCGRMGKVREQAVRAAGGTVVADLDVDRTLAEALQPVQVLGEGEDLPWQILDVVFVCTPPGARGPTERRAIEHEIPLFLEKPIGLSAQIGDDLLAALSVRPVLTAVGYHNRYRWGVESLREQLIGEEVLGISAHWIAGPYAKPWWLEPTQSGGPVNEQATHIIDLIRYLVPEIEEVSFVGATATRGRRIVIPGVPISV